MKKLLTIAAVLTLSGNAYAVNPNDTAGAIEDFIQAKSSTTHSHQMPLSSNNFWAENGELLNRYSNQTDSSETLSDRTGNQPEVGSVMHEHMLPQSNDFWNTNTAILVRNHNPDS